MLLKTGFIFLKKISIIHRLLRLRILRKKYHIPVLAIIAILFFCLFIFTGCSAFLRNEQDGLAEEQDTLIEEFEDAAEDNDLQKSTAFEKMGNKADQRNAKNIFFSIEYAFSITGDTEKIEFTTLIPHDYEKRQEVIEINFSIEPDEIFIDKNGFNKYATFKIEKPLEDFSIHIDSEMRIFQYDLKEAMRSYERQDYHEPKLQDYLIEEEFIYINDPYLNNIEVLKTLKQDPLENVKDLFDYVLENMSYFGYNPGAVGGIEALKSGGGDCTEYSDALITLCRACGIPARMIEGYVMDIEEINIGHNWVEIYLDDYGWVPFDPTFADTSRDPSRFSFENLHNSYIYLSSIRNDANLANYHFFFYYYWGDPLTVNKHISITEY